MRKKITLNFRICISVPLTPEGRSCFLGKLTRSGSEYSSALYLLQSEDEWLLINHIYAQIT